MLKNIGIGVLVLTLLLGLTWLFQGNDFFMYKFFGLKYENTRRENAVNKRWADYHTSCACPIYDQPHAYGEYEITIKSIRSGKVNVLYLHEGERRDSFLAELNGQPFKPGKVSISTVTRIIRKSIVKTKSGRVI